MAAEVHPVTAARDADARRILLFVPNVLRDFEGHALVAYHLERRFGHRVEFCLWNEVERKLLSFAPDVLVLDFLGWSPRVRQARLARSLGIRVAILPTAGLFMNAEGDALRAGKLTAEFDLIDAYLAWGDASRRTLEEQGIVAPSRIHVIGSPRFDLHAPPFTTLVEERGRFLRRVGIADPEAPVIVWASGTYFTRIRHHDLETEVRRQASQTNTPESELRDEYADDRTQWVEHSALVRALAQRHPEWHFLIKVHPNEVVAPYAAFASELPNLHLAHDVPIRDVLCHATVLIQHYSTTATEAWMLGKPVLEPTMGGYRTPGNPEFLSGNHLVADLDEAEAAIAGYVAGAPVPEAQRDVRAAFIADIYHRTDGRSAERCAERIDALISPPAYDDAERARTQERVRAEYAQWRAADARRMGSRVKRLLRIDQARSLRFWRFRRARRGDGPAGGAPAAADRPITEATVQLAYARYDRAWRARTELGERTVPGVAGAPEMRGRHG